MAERPFYVCNIEELKRNIKQAVINAALAEVADHACYVHELKTACEAILTAREMMDKNLDRAIDELESCLKEVRHCPEPVSPSS